VRSALFLLGLLALSVGVVAGVMPVTGEILPSGGGVSIDVLGQIGAEVDIECGSVFQPANDLDEQGSLLGRLTAGATNCEELLAERQTIVLGGLGIGALFVLLSIVLTLLVLLGRGARWALREK
jgi:hypothetical protein